MLCNEPVIATEKGWTLTKEAHACACWNSFVRVDIRFQALHTIPASFHVGVVTCFLHPKDEACFAMTLTSNWGFFVAYRALIYILPLYTARRHNPPDAC